MSRGLSERQRRIVAILTRRGAQSTLQVCRVLFPCPHGLVSECRLSSGLACSPVAAREQIMFTVRRALNSLQLRGLVAAEYRRATDHRGRLLPNWEIEWTTSDSRGMDRVGSPLAKRPQTTRSSRRNR